jgi:hypothetical protein
MMAITTNSSIKVNPLRDRRGNMTVLLKMAANKNVSTGKSRAQKCPAGMCSVTCPVQRTEIGRGLR